MRLLLIEDDEILGDGIAEGLREYTYTVDWIKVGNQFDSAVSTTSYDAIILDWNLPGEPGLALLQRYRNSGKAVPVLMLTARDTLEDKINGLDHGADDYMVKPFDLDELAARIRALIRRGHGRSHPLLTNGDIIMDIARHEVTKAGATVSLSLREFSLLQLLLENAGKVLSKFRIEDSLYAWGHEIESNTIEVHIHNLRKKIGADMIKTIRGVGYVIR